MEPTEQNLKQVLLENGFNVILNNARDRRTLAYLFGECGVARVRRAHEQLKGRLPFVSTLANILGVTIPERVIATPREQGHVEIEKIKADLRKRLNR
jgi:hypothetical protein